VLNCGCDNRRDIMFTQGNGQAPLVALLIIGAVVVYIII
jgi:hypothetical protein